MVPDSPIMGWSGGNDGLFDFSGQAGKAMRDARWRDGELGGEGTGRDISS